MRQTNPYTGEYEDDPTNPDGDVPQVPFPYAPGAQVPEESSPGWTGQTPPPGWEDANRPPGGFHYDQTTGSWVPDAPGTSTATPPPAAAPSNVGPFTGQFSPPPTAQMPTLPGVPDAPIPNLPTYTPPPAWKAPSVDEALTDPGYQARIKAGNQGLQGWAAAKGTLNDTGTANALQDYNQNAASQEYQQVWNRDYDAYKTNVQTQYVDPFTFNYRSALDLNTPKVQQWQAGVDMSKLGYATGSAATQHANDMSYLDTWNQFLNSQDLWKYNTNNALSLAGA